MQEAQDHFTGRQLRLPFSFWLLVGTVVLLLIGSSYIAWQLCTKPYDDLPTFYWATRLAFEQQLSAYQPDYFRQLGGSLGRKIYPFLYPPPSLLLFSPFLLCESYDQCKGIFSVLNLLLWWCLALCLYQWFLRIAVARGLSLTWAVLIPVLTLCYIPWIDTLKNGQVNLIVLICLMPILFSPKCPWQQVIAGILLGCAMILKVYLLILLPVLMIFRRWREVMVSMMFVFSLVLLSTYWLPGALWQEWWSLGQSAGYGKGIPGLLTIPFNQSFNGFFIRLFLEQRGAGQSLDWVLWIYVVVAICAAAVAWSVVTRLRHWHQGDSAALALALLFVNLAAPLTWLHHYVFALPAILWVVVLLSSLRLPSPLKRIVALCVFLAVLFLAMPQLASILFSQWSHQALDTQGMPIGKNLLLSVPLLAGTAIFLAFIGLIAERSPQAKTAPSGNQSLPDQPHHKT